MAATSLTRQEVDEFLRRIRLNKGVDDPEGLHYDNVQDLNKSLHLLADQLYTKPTHFLLELIQNADDNNFISGTPCLSFNTNLPGTTLQMRIDCNEAGFTKENVKAICSIGQSTKKTIDRQKGFIGEKGIGFKSVFKVADVVRISSGPFQFKLDRRKTLGMIAPILERFPVTHIVPGQTQMLLLLKQASDMAYINEELQEVEPELLIFLRKLCILTICTPIRHVQFQTYPSKFEDGFKGETLSLKTSTFRDGKFYQNSLKKYIIVRHVVKDLPEDERRPGVSESEVILAFSVLENTNPVIEDQNVHAYLPIDNYGFAYLIQADFLLTANREGVETLTEWNIYLRNSIKIAFRKAAQRFAKVISPSPCPGLRYTWPAFLREQGRCTSKFWSKLKERILIDLATEYILESRDETAGLLKPSTLLYIPKKFRLDGEPLVEDTQNKMYHLSFLYDSVSTGLSPELESIGVREMGDRGFFREFKSLIMSHGEQFLRSQSEEWHIKIGRILRRTTTPQQVADIPLVPLRNGRWMCHSKKNIFLESRQSKLTVPNGIDIFLVDPDVCRNEERMKFFNWLRIRTCDQAEVCSMIMELHAGLRPRSLNDLISDAVYLFRSRVSYKESAKRLRLVDNCSKVGFGKDLYVDHPSKAFAISKFADNTESSVRLIHPNYFSYFDDKRERVELVEWLVQQLDISTLPRIVRDDQMTPEFKFFMKNNTKDLLLLLRDNWYHYTSQIYQPIKITPFRTRTVMKELSEMSVKCTDGSYHPLGTTVLPLADLKSVASLLPFIEIPYPANSRWLEFAALGLLTEECLELYLRQLKAMTKIGNLLVEKSAVREIYRQLAARSTSSFSSASVRQEFDENPLVFHAKDKRWMLLKDCVWEAPACITNVYALATEYSDCKSLFCTRLKLQNAKIDHVVTEILSLATSGCFNKYKELLLVLNDYLEKGSPSAPILKLRGKKIIPVTKSHRIEERTDACLMTYNLHLWYFADRVSLQDSFKGKVYLIDFTVAEVRRLSPLIKAMGLKDYLLSEAVVETTEFSGDPIYDPDGTTELRNRAKYFTRLVPTPQISAKEMDELKTRLFNLTVWGVPSIKVKREVDDIHGTEDTGDLVFEETDATLKIFMLIDSPNKPMSTYRLSQAFIKHCGITDTKYQQLVMPILTIPITEIEKLLEVYNLDGFNDNDSEARLPDSLFSDLNDDVQLASAAELPDSGEFAAGKSSAAVPESISGPMSSLRARIPTLDQSIEKVREYAASRATGARSILFSSEAPSIGKSVISKGETGSYAHEDFGFGDSVSSQTPTPDSESSTEESQDISSRGAFNFETLRSALPETPARVAPGRRMLGIGNSSVSRRSGRVSYGQNEGFEEENSLQGLRQKHIGLLGEAFIDEYLSKRLPDWSEANWTSKSRVNAGRSAFTEMERDFADFTYFDSKGALTRLLLDNGFKIAQNWLADFDKPPTYHLEIKATTEKCSEPFYMSNNQVEKARGYVIPSSGVPSDIYVIFRVYDLQQIESKPDFVIYVDPWTLYLEKKLLFRAWDKYTVTPSSFSNGAEG